MKKIKLLFSVLCLFGMVSLAAQQTISGTVTDTSGVPLPGVTVLVKGTSTGVATDFDGNYQINAAIGAVLEFSFIGLVTKSITVGNSSTINVTLGEDTQLLDEVVIIGYGTSTKKDLVSAVSSISADVIENQAVARVDQALQGRAAGVEVVSNNGEPGSGATIRIRGNSSITGNNNPLFVIDGYIVGTGFNLNNINANDIESVNILKDATALAIYGTRGAAGVILITTKSGKAAPKGKPTISVNSFTSIDMLANEIDIVKGIDYIDYVNEASQFTPGPLVDFNGTSLQLGFTDPSLPLEYDDPSNTPVTDWLDVVTTTGIKHNLDISVLGNTDNSNYYSSLNYYKEDGIIRNSGLERIVFRTNYDVNISDRFKTGIRLNVTSQKRENNKVNFGNVVAGYLPTRTIYDDDGNFTGINNETGSLQRNPEADIQLRVNHNLVTNIVANTYFEYELFKDFRLKSTIGATLNFYKNNQYLPGLLPERLLDDAGGFARIAVNHGKDILNENSFTYKKGFGKHSLDLLGGFTWQKITAEGTTSSADRFPNDVVQFNNLEFGSDPLTYQVQSSYNQRTLASFLGRFTYAYDGKYILTLVGRQDGSSVFEAGNKYAFFPSVGIAWNIDEEDFMENLNAVNTLKLRGSFGKVGEQGVSPYNSFDLYQNEAVYFNENQYPAIILDTPGTSGLKWETTEQLDVGLELGLFNNRIVFEAGYYKKTTSDLLLSVQPPLTASNSRFLKNVGSVENKGFEFLLSTVNIDESDFQWNSTLTVSGNRSKVLDIGDEDFIALQSTGNQGGNSARLIVGETVPAFVGAEYLGTYKDPQEIIDDGTEGRSFLGSPRFRDVDGDGVINNNDYSVIGSPEADFYGGFRNTFSYKGVTLDIFFHGSYGAEIFNVRTQTSFYGRGATNLDPRVLDRWIPGVNETSDVPRAGTSTSLFNPNSTLNVEDGSFLRLKSVTLSYDLPLKNMKLDNIFKSINLYVTGKNLALFSKFRLGDPEVNSFTSASTNNGFGGISQGFASGQYPYARSIVTGLKLEF